VTDRPRDPDPQVKLLLRCRRGSDKAARTLWADHARSVRACALALTRDGHAADDVVQRVFCSILETDRRTLARVRDVRAYLMAAARNTSHSYLRSESRRARRERHDRERCPPTLLSDESLSAAIEALPTELREVLIVRAAGDLTFDQLALALGINRSTAASRYRSALDRLRGLLDPPADRQDPHNNGSSLPKPAEAHHAR